VSCRAHGVQTSEASQHGTARPRFRSTARACKRLAPCIGFLQRLTVVLHSSVSEWLLQVCAVPGARAPPRTLPRRPWQTARVWDKRERTRANCPRDKSASTHTFTRTCRRHVAALVLPLLMKIGPNVVYTDCTPQLKKHQKNQPKKYQKNR
jgi:hypothetical protein